LNRTTVLALLSLSAAYFTVGTASLLVVALSAPLAGHLRVSPAAVANLLTVFALTFAVSAPLAQVLLGHLPRRALLIGGLCVLSAATALAAVVDDYWLVFAARLAAGAGAAVVGPMCSAIAAGLVRPEQHGRALALVFSGMTLATVLGVPLSAWLGGWAGWKAVFLLVSGVGLLTTLAVWRLVHDRSRGARVTLPALLRVVTSRRSGMSVATTMLQMAAQFATYALVVAFLLERMGGTHEWVVAVLFAFGIGGVAGNLLAGSLADRLGADRTVWLSLVGLAAVFALLLIAPAQPALALVLAVVWAVTGILFQAPQQKRLIAIDPESRSLLLASNASALYLGMSVGAFLAGLAYHLYGASVLPALSLVLIGAAAWTFSQSRLGKQMVFAGRT
jgi:MFS transporter, DHA1 family, inner membrane transport protein